MLTKTGYLVVFYSLLSLVISFFFSLIWIYIFLIFTLLFLSINSFLFFLNFRRIKYVKIKRECPSKVYYNSPFTIELKIINDSNKKINNILIFDQIPKGFEIFKGKIGIYGKLNKGINEVKYLLKPLEIGLHEFKKVKLIIFDPLMLFWKEKEFNVNDEIECLPVVFSSFVGIAIRNITAVKEFGIQTSKIKGSGFDFYGIKEYEYGDDLRNVAWFVVAKSPERKLFTIEKEEEKRSEIIVALDLSETMNEGNEGQRKFDLVSISLINLANFILKRGSVLNFIAFSSNIIKMLKIERLSSLTDLILLLSKTKCSGLKDFNILRNYLYKNVYKFVPIILITDRYLNYDDINNISDISKNYLLKVIIINSFENLIYDNVLKIYIDIENNYINELINILKKYKIDAINIDLKEITYALTELYIKYSKYGELTRIRI